jgi:hypothetical protein
MLGFQFLPNIFFKINPGSQVPNLTNFNSEYFNLITQYSLMNSIHASYFLIVVGWYIRKNGLSWNTQLAILLITLFSLLPKAFYSFTLIKQLNSLIYYMPIISLAFMILAIMVFTKKIRKNDLKLN